MFASRFARPSVALLIALCACGGSDDSGGKGAAGGGEGCPGLCTGGGFGGGEEVDFGGGVIECQCSGEGDGLQADDCASYCADFGVAPDRSYITSEFAPNDKCVCDGSGG